jgi:hypothetical protein
MDAPGTLEVVAGAVSVSAAEAGASATVENDRALMIKVRMDVRLPLRAIFFFLTQNDTG